MKNQLLMSGTLAATAALALGFAGCNSEGGGVGDTCISTDEYFAQAYFNVMKSKCASCHQVGGVGAQKSDFKLRPSSEAGYLEANLEATRALAKTVSGETSILLQKPVGGLGHEGGKVISEGDSDYKILTELTRRLSADTEDSCPNTEARYLAGVEMMSPIETLRKAALVLAARLPTAEEEAAVTKGGFEALDPILDKFMEEQPFYDRLKEKYNDIVLTDFYLGQADAIGGDGDNGTGYDPEWFLNVPDTAANRQKYGVPPNFDGDDGALHSYLRMLSNRAIAQAPLELVAYIVRHNRPYTEIANANYMVVNPFSAPAYGISDVSWVNDADPYEFQAGRIGGYESGYPHAGMMSDPIWLLRHPTTITNRNRHRAKEALYLFLGNDILKAAERPIDITAVQRATNPTVNDTNCSVCHTAVDPVAAGFMNFQVSDDDESQFAFNPDFKWYDEMWEPGYQDVDMPPSAYTNALPWTMNMIAQDPAFAFAGVFMAYRIAVGQEPLLPPPDPNDLEFQADLTAYLGQYYTFSKISKNFRDKHGYNFKLMMKEVVMSPYFRAKNTAADISTEQLVHLGGVGTAHLLTPEEFNRKLERVLHINWADGQTPNFLSSEGDSGYKMLFGGIDSIDVTKRIKEPNGIMANVIERMSLEVGCQLIANEFSLPQSERLLFTQVEPGTEPQDANGYDIPQATAAIRGNIVHLHNHLLGEKFAATDPEIERTYQLFLQTWKEGKPLTQKPTDEGGLGQGFLCGTNTNYLTGVTLEPVAEGDKSPQALWRGGDGGANDPLYTGRAWMAVMVYMLTDYNFAYE